MSYNANHYDARADEDIVDVLTAISVVSKRLASNLPAHGAHQRKLAQCCRCYFGCR